MSTGEYVACGAVAVCATPFATWWLIGDASTSQRPPSELDYIAHAPDVAPWVVTTVGCVALIAALGAVGLIVHGVRRREFGLRWLGVVLLLMFAGAVLAAIGRVVTAGTIGANIGGGIAIFLGLPFVVLVVGCAAVMAALGRVADRREANSRRSVSPAP